MKVCHAGVADVPVLKGLNLDPPPHPHNTAEVLLTCVKNEFPLPVYA